MSQAAGFALALLIGVTLGMLGGGGSILTVPVFVYVLGFAAKDAVAMSLPVVGTTSLVGAAGHWRAGNIDGRAIAVFAPSAMIGALVGARVAALLAGTTQLAVLGVVMLVAGALMLRDGVGRSDPEGERRDGRGGHVLLAISGLGVGLLTGLVGIGGGFMIVPALVLVGRVPMKRAVGTSLLVITLSTLSGLVGYRGQANIAWGSVALFTGLAVVGVVIGTRLARALPAHALRRGFGVLVVALAALILFQNRGAVAVGGSPRRVAPVDR